MPDLAVSREEEPEDFTDLLDASFAVAPSHPAVTNSSSVTIDQEWAKFANAERSEWALFCVVVVSLVLVEQYMSRRVREGSHRSHVLMVIAWILCALSYNAAYAFRHGRRSGLEWFIGYVLEWMLSVDNLFAFRVIVRAYRAPPAIQRKALFCGVAGAIISRLVLFFAIGRAMHGIHIMQFVFGLLLLYSGLQAVVSDDDDQQPADFWVVRLLKWCLGSRLKETYDEQGQSLFVTENGRLCATLLVPLIFCVEVTDIVFAVDSVSAKVAQIPNQFIAYTSSVMALLGLRAMFFVIDDMVNCFEMLKYGVCFILCFIGFELMAAGWLLIPDWLVCLVIVSVFNFCIVLSLLVKLAAMVGPRPTNGLFGPRANVFIWGVQPQPAASTDPQLPEDVKAPARAGQLLEGGADDAAGTRGLEVAGDVTKSSTGGQSSTRSGGVAFSRPRPVDR